MTTILVTDANARLMTAAPKLLEACRAATDALGRAARNDLNVHAAMEIRDRCVAAIAEATGEEMTAQ